MPRLDTHPLALFSLIPRNERAEAVVADPLNDHLASLLEGILVLDIGLNVRSKSCNTLATLGRGDVDVYVAGSSISKTQCSFERDPNTNVVMLYDRSHSQTTRVFGGDDDESMPFEYGRLRKVVVQDKVNTMLGMGGEGRNLVLFGLKWHLSATEMIGKNWKNISPDIEDNPRVARTIDDAETVLPSRRETRPHTSGRVGLKMRYATIDRIGSGKFGEVYKVVDADLGRLMAVKILKQAVSGATEEQEVASYYALKREVETLARFSHPCIVDYIASQGWGGPKVEIFMGLKEGTLESLVEIGTATRFADSLFLHMLQALDFLAFHGIIHRDVKPENILYVTGSDGQYLFQLGDFGLCNRKVIAESHVGTPIYMAPEFYQKKEQTHKVDVWALFVTMLWTLDTGFRQMCKSHNSVGEIQKAVSLAASQSPTVALIKEMAIVDAENRASAAQMLLKHYKGEGLSTPQNQVPALRTTPAAPATPVSRAGQPKGPQNHASPPSAAGQYGVGKALQDPSQRLALDPMTGVRLGQAFTPPFAENPQIPGGFPFGNAPFDNAPFDNAPFDNAPFGNAPFGNAPFDNAPFGNAPFGNAPFGNAPFDNAPFGNTPFGNAPFGNANLRPRKSRERAGKGKERAYFS
ncbi:CAMK family protein kinase [Histoplasma capsulatum var. duboisii H88]|uniref:non-specific serine/threonine protein kinase n=1 Tax=Ajellomyces capsulatus (strain H88) TaxID=544711 RepID=F0UJA4_AJEC8|nr:CAMK family protein kinase [Histoplasma capsulatum var. duboisii H88]QSS57170.1 CAMK family protein kinase [Histoplasma capsulatum var. duboisii H88]